MEEEEAGYMVLPTSEARGPFQPQNGARFLQEAAVSRSGGCFYVGRQHLQRRLRFDQSRGLYVLTKGLQHTVSLYRNNDGRVHKLLLLMGALEHRHFWVPTRLGANASATNEGARKALRGLHVTLHLPAHERPDLDSSTSPLEYFFSSETYQVTPRILLQTAKQIRVRGP